VPRLRAATRVDETVEDVAQLLDLDLEPPERLAVILAGGERVEVPVSLERGGEYQVDERSTRR